MLPYYFLMTKSNANAIDKPSQTGKPSQLEWKDGNFPISLLFEDSYYSAPDDGHDGLEESRAVFIEGNRLPDRWQQADSFTIAELGFGTGLNFFETASQWFDSAPDHASLHYISFEKYPLSKAQILQALQPWSELHALARKLFISWRWDDLASCNSGLGQKIKPYIFEKDTKTVSLYLMIGDANALLPEWGEGRLEPLKLLADAWYLDGFSPAKNPELWNQSLMQHIYDLTAPAGTFSTYTSAGHVRRALSAAGFEVTKVDGFGKKRHRLEGVKI